MSQAEELLETLSTGETPVVFPTAEPGFYERGSNFTKLVSTWDDYIKDFEETYGGDVINGRVLNGLSSEYDVVIPEGVTEVIDLDVGDVVFPSSTETINMHFGYDDVTMYLNATIPPAFWWGGDRPKKIVVLNGYLDAYKIDRDWRGHSDIMVEPEEEEPPNIFPTAEPGIYERGSNFTKLVSTWDDAIAEGDIYTYHDVIIPEGVTDVDICCRHVVIPSSIECINYNSDVDSLAVVYFKATTPPDIDTEFFTSSVFKKVVVPKGCLEVYQDAGFDGFADSIVEGEMEEPDVEPDTNIDTDTEHVVIGSDRNITVPESLKRIAVQYDHNVETVTFDCPRYWDGIDFSTGFAVYINYMLTDGTLGSYVAKNIRVDADDEDVIHFTWTISNNVTLVQGKLTFLVCIKKVGTDGVEVNHWNSELCRDLYVSEGLETTETVSEMYPDFITQVLITVDRINKSDYGTVVARIEALETAVNPTEDEDNLTGRLVVAEGDIGALETKMTTVEGGIDTLETKMTTVEGGIDTLETKMTTVEGGIDTLGQRMNAAGSTIGELDSRISAAEHAISSIAGTFGPLGEPCTKLTKSGIYHIVVYTDNNGGTWFNPGLVSWRTNDTSYASMGSLFVLCINHYGNFETSRFTVDLENDTLQLSDATIAGNVSVYAKLLYEFPASE